MPPKECERLSLLAFQRRFWRLVTAPQGVTKGLQTVIVDDGGAHPVSGWIIAANEGAAHERLDVYANMYFFRLLEALRHEVPKVAALLGHERFHNVVVDYLLVHPSRDPSLRHAANALPRFLASHAEGQTRADLADVATLELARNDVFDAADVDAVEPSALGAIPAEAWPQLRFGLVPSVRWLRVSASAAPTWQAAAAQAKLPPVDLTPCGCVVWRSGLQSWHRPCSLAEIEALQAVTNGAVFADVCEILAQGAVVDDEDPAGSARPALDALSRWVADGFLAWVRV